MTLKNLRKMKNKVEIPCNDVFETTQLRASGFEYTIPEGYEAEIRDGKVIVRNKEAVDRRIREDIISLIKFALNDGSAVSPGSRTTKEEAIYWLDKQGDMASILENIDRYIDICAGNAHEMDDSHPEKPYYLGFDDALSAISGLLSGMDVDELLAPEGEPEESTEVKSEGGGWKPTEQQLRCLGYAIQKYEPYEAKHHVLTDLYEDLKKLCDDGRKA